MHRCTNMFSICINAHADSQFLAHQLVQSKFDVALLDWNKFTLQLKKQRIKKKTKQTSTLQCRNWVTAHVFSVLFFFPLHYSRGTFQDMHHVTLCVLRAGDGRNHTSGDRKHHHKLRTQAQIYLKWTGTLEWHEPLVEPIRKLTLEEVFLVVGEEIRMRPWIRAVIKKLYWKT